MKRIAWSLVAFLALAIPVAPGIGAASEASEEPWRLTTAGWANGDIEHLRTVPFETGAAVGGVIHDGHLYVSTWRSFSIYDVSAPTEPVLLSLTPLAAQRINEGPSTNGEVLLLADDSNANLQIWDVRDKTAPVLAAEVAHENPDHIWTCVLYCTFTVEKADGSIVETAGFLAHGTEAFVPLWASEAILYVVDTARGLDVFRVDVRTS